MSVLVTASLSSLGRRRLPEALQEGKRWEGLRIVRRRRAAMTGGIGRYASYSLQFCSILRNQHDARNAVFHVSSGYPHSFGNFSDIPLCPHPESDPAPGRIRPLQVSSRRPGGSGHRPAFCHERIRPGQAYPPGRPAPAARAVLFCLPAVWGFGSIVSAFLCLTQLRVGGSYL